MKRITALCLMIMIALTGAAAPVKAESEAILSFSAGSDGEKQIVTVDLAGGSGPEMLQFCITYDAEMLQLVSIEPGKAFNGALAPTLSNPRPGRMFLVWDALDPLQDGELLILQFTWCADAYGETTVILNKEEETVAADGQFREIPLNTDKAEIRLEKAVEITDPDEFYETVKAEEPEPKPAAELPAEELPAAAKKETAPKNKVFRVKEADDETLFWTSSNEHVATVKNGRITAMAPGIAYITAESEDGTVRVQYRITVAEDGTASLARKKDHKTSGTVWMILAAGGAVLLCLVLLMGRKNRRNRKKKTTMRSEK